MVLVFWDVTWPLRLLWADGENMRKIVERRCFGFRKCRFWRAQSGSCNVSQMSASKGAAFLRVQYSWHQPSKIGEYSAQDLWTSWSWQLGWHRDRYSRTPMAIWRIVPKNRWLLDCKMMLFLDFQKKHLDNSLRTPRVYMTHALYAMSIYVYRMVFDQFLCNRTAGELSNYAILRKVLGVSSHNLSS